MPDWIEIERRRLLAEAEAEFWQRDREKEHSSLARGWWIAPAVIIGACIWALVIWALVIRGIVL